jgi:hypothetical protein
LHSTENALHTEQVTSTDDTELEIFHNYPNDNLTNVAARLCANVNIVVLLDDVLPASVTICEGHKGIDRA